MLEELYLENIVLFENATLPFEAGLNVISGETGAGKSLVAGALGLALGARATPDLIRNDTDTARISAVFRWPAHPDALTVLNELDIPDDGDPLIFERLLSTKRSSRLSLSGRPATTSSVRPLADALLDMAAQNEHTRLTDPGYQRQLLDAFGGLSSTVNAFARSFRAAHTLWKRLESGDAEKERNRLLLEEVRYKLEMIEEIAFDPETDPQIEERIRTLQSSESIRALAEEGILDLYEGEDALSDRTGSLLRKTEVLADRCPALARACEELRSLQATLAEAVAQYRDAADDADASPEELERTIERAEALKSLTRRLQCAVHEIPAIEADLSAQEESLAGWQTDTSAAREDLSRLLQEAATAGAALHTARTKAAATLSKAVNRQLKDLGMPEARFSVTQSPLWTEQDAPETMLRHASAAGLHTVAFCIAANPGEAAATLADGASGGEAARTMLAIKSALSGAHTPPTLFFDEIDAGVGGRLGDVIGRKLHELAADRQIIVITHLPQIAAYADHHLKVSKATRKKRTCATIETLSDEARIEEIAQMIHGTASTATTRAQAREMIEQAAVYCN